VTAYNHRPFKIPLPPHPIRTLTPTYPSNHPRHRDPDSRTHQPRNHQPHTSPARRANDCLHRHTRPATGPNRVSRSVPRRPHSSLCVVSGGYHRKQHTITLASAFEGRR
jgi:hypothetical protein